MNTSVQNEKINVNEIDQIIDALRVNGIEARFSKNGEEAKKEVFSIIPEGAEVLTMTSVTLDTLGIAKEINESGKFVSSRNKLNAGGEKKRMKEIGAASDWVIGSAHALTEDGKILIASNTGSQLPAYAYASGKVVFVIGAQKIVKNFDEGLKRIYEYVLPLESERARKAYGVAGSFVSKLLVINKEVEPGRIHVVIVGEPVGF